MSVRHAGACFLNLKVESQTTGFTFVFLSIVVLVFFQGVSLQASQDSLGAKIQSTGPQQTVPPPSPYEEVFRRITMDTATVALLGLVQGLDSTLRKKALKYDVAFSAQILDQEAVKNAGVRVLEAEQLRTHPFYDMNRRRKSHHESHTQKLSAPLGALMRLLQEGSLGNVVLLDLEHRIFRVPQVLIEEEKARGGLFEADRGILNDSLSFDHHGESLRQYLFFLATLPDELLSEAMDQSLPLAVSPLPDMTSVVDTLPVQYSGNVIPIDAKRNLEMRAYGAALAKAMSETPKLKTDLLSVVRKFSGGAVGFSGEDLGLLRFGLSGRISLGSSKFDRGQPTIPLRASLREIILLLRSQYFVETIDDRDVELKGLPEFKKWVESRVADFKEATQGIRSWQRQTWRDSVSFDAAELRDKVFFSDGFTSDVLWALKQNFLQAQLAQEVGRRIAMGRVDSLRNLKTSAQVDVDPSQLMYVKARLEFNGLQVSKAQPKTKMLTSGRWHRFGLRGEFAATLRWLRTLSVKPLYMRLVDRPLFCQQALRPRNSQ